MTANEGVILAVGNAPPLNVGIWRSRDAVLWTQVDVGHIGENAILLAVAPWRRGFAAVGIRYTFATDGIQRDGIVMTSSDGTHWRRADLPGGHGAVPNAIATHRGALVAGGCIGVTRVGGCLFAADAQAAAWTSPDARGWTRRLLPDGEHAFVNAIASVGRNTVLVGSEVEVDPSRFSSAPVAAAIWEGPTAAAVERVHDPALDQGVGNGVVPYRGTFLAVGGQSACVQAWMPDRAGWQTIDDPWSLCDQQMSAVVTFHGAVYATGFDFYYSALPVWRSRDGGHWTTVTDSAMAADGLMFEGDAMVEWHGRLVIAGSAFKTDGVPDGQIWVGTPSN